jgi:hypothetical protein
MRQIVTALLLLLAACGEGVHSDATADAGVHHVSTGLKIFLTSRKHGADFKNDPFLSGDSAVHKADDFCNTDPNRPDAHAYKALLVDGVNRDAKAPADWVLKPGTTYYRPQDDVVIGTTTGSAIFGAAYAPLTNPVVSTIAPTDTGTEVWSGIANAADFTAGECCNGWSDLTNSSSARWAIPTATDGSAFGTNGTVGCFGFQFWIYCVEQP